MSNADAPRALSSWLRSATPLALLALCACAARSPTSRPEPLVEEVREALGHEWKSDRFAEARSRLEPMGPELDAALVLLALEPQVEASVRVNAMLLLADRKSPAALGTLRRVLLGAEDEAVRSGAVLGLHRLAGEDPRAAQAIRAAVSDPSLRVRINALQALDVRDAAIFRELLSIEKDPDARAIAAQLLSLAEARGAPLERDRSGRYTTVVREDLPYLHFEPSRQQVAKGALLGALWISLPQGDSALLADGVEMVGGVLPAFFAPDRSAVVYEAHRQIRIYRIEGGTTVDLGPGIAPRVIPLAEQFVFLRERVDEREETAKGLRLRYDVYSVPFDVGLPGGRAPEWIGRLAAIARGDRYASYSPVRWMVVDEVPEGFVLRGEQVETFLLPSPFERVEEPSSGGATDTREGGER